MQPRLVCQGVWHIMASMCRHGYMLANFCHHMSCVSPCLHFIHDSHKDKEMAVPRKRMHEQHLANVTFFCRIKKEAYAYSN